MRCNMRRGYGVGIRSASKHAAPLIRDLARHAQELRARRPAPREGNRRAQMIMRSRVCSAGWQRQVLRRPLIRPSAPFSLRVRRLPHDGSTSAMRVRGVFCDLEQRARDDTIAGQAQRLISQVVMGSPVAGSLPSFSWMPIWPSSSRMLSLLAKSLRLRASRRAVMRSSTVALSMASSSAWFASERSSSSLL